MKEISTFILITSSVCSLYSSLCTTMKRPIAFVPFLIFFSLSEFLFCNLLKSFEVHRNAFKKSLGHLTLRFGNTSRFETIDSLLSLISRNRDTCVHETITDVLSLTSSMHLAKINVFAL